MTNDRGVLARHLIRVHRRTVAALVILISVVGLLASTQPAYAVHSGSDASVIRGEIQLEVAGSYRCTGTLISSDWVLTAKHCITDSPAANPDNTIIRVGSVTRGQGFQRAGIQFVLHQSLDSALIKLNSALPAALAVRVGGGVLGAPAGGDPHPTVTASGWGETDVNPGHPSATLQVATMTTATGSGAPPNHYRLVPASGDSGIPARGDSGAGVMYYGVMCGQIEEGTTLGGGYADAVATDALASWIRHYARVPVMQNACSGASSRNKVLRLMALGDSITYGIGSSDGNGYRARLQSLLAKAGAQVDLVGSQRSGDMGDNENEGHPGYTISQLISVAKTYVDDYRPNVITLHIGTNDLNDDVDPAGAPARLSQLLDTIYAADPDVTVVLASLIPSRLSATEQRIQQFNSQLPEFIDTYPRYSHKHLVFADMDAVQTGDLVDDLHPTDAGYAKMASVFADGVEAAVSYGYVTNRPGGGVTGTPGPDPSLGRWSDQGVIAGGVGADPNSTLLRFADIDGDGRNDYLVVDKNGAVDAWRNEGLISASQAARQRSAAGPDNAPPVARSSGETWGWYHLGTIAHGIGAPGDEIKFADINGDGRADYLAVHPDGSVAMYLNGGYINGKWDWIDYGTIKNGIGEPGGDIQLADVTGDGRADYLYVNPSMGAIHLIENDGGTPGHWNWTDRGVVATGVFSNADDTVQLRDINDDGFADYLYISKTNGTVDAYTNHGFQAGKWDWVPQGQVAPGTGATSADHRVYEADIDADGRADYLSVDRFGAVHAYLDEGRDQSSVADWLPKGRIAGGIGVPGTDVRLADLDNDGLADYLAVHQDGSVTAYLNGGSKPTGGWDWIDRGTVFTPPKSTPASQVQFADVNHDGRADALVVSSGGRTGVWLNESKSSAVSPGDFHFLEYESTDALAGEGGIENGGRVVFADIDGDGYSDYAMIRDNGAVDFARNSFADGSNEFEGMSWRVQNGVGSPGLTARLADVDRDGRADYLVIGPNGDVHAFFNKPGVNQYSANWINGGRIADGVGSPISQVQFADVDGDGRADYLVVADDGSITAYLNNRT